MWIFNYIKLQTERSAPASFSATDLSLQYILDFSALTLNRQLFHNLEKQGLSSLTPVQEQAIPAILTGRNCLTIAPTGTGKTEAFAIPILEQLLRQRKDEGPTVLVLLPTRELCIQTQERIANLTVGTEIHTVSFYGGGSYEKQLAAYADAQIILATPGRLMDFMAQGVIDLNSITTLVIDEFDQLLDMGFAKAIHTIMGTLPTTRQSIFQSATKTPEIEKIVRKKLRDPVEILVEERKTGGITEYVLYVDKNDKKNLVRYLLENKIQAQAIIFTRTVHGVERIQADLVKNGIAALALYGNKSQQQREEIITKFRNKESRILIATDLLARGIDFPDLEAIINYEVPDSPDTYTHRIGRTGRSHLNGTALTFCDAEDNQKWINLQLSLKRQIKIDDQHPYLLSWKKMLSSSHSNSRNAQSKSRKRR